ncbi:unnamed protein product [Cylindrotheca closterium]|uniref:Uncharacterized protein n=1 Tax=Cylindrotheca closterium TaxID=2856 RepID=A0AAD2FX18_9STRA|nr:unnamed protein product [Cylindrotheca closterium]
MAERDLWYADNGYSIQAEDLSFRLEDWPSPDAKINKVFALRLEDLTQLDDEYRTDARNRNLTRLEAAKTRQYIQSIDIPYTGCNDTLQYDALLDLLSFDDRTWESFTMNGMNNTSDFFAKPISWESLCLLFGVLKNVKSLNLISYSSAHRGHGLEEILQTIFSFDGLKELRLEGWQMDRVSTSSLFEHIGNSESNSIKLLSLKSCCFIGDETVEKLVEGLPQIEKLQTLNLGFCNLKDADIIQLSQQLQSIPSVQNLHIGGNNCLEQESVNSISEWLSDESCQLQDLNLSSLWIGFGEEGLLQRFVDLIPLFQAVAENRSLHSLALADNHIENIEIKELCYAMKKRDDLIYLDIAENPFNEIGAEVLRGFVQQATSMEGIRFENTYMQYRCAESIKFLVKWNSLSSRLGGCKSMPLSLWPLAFARLKSELNDRYDHTDYSSDATFRLLHTLNGEFGHPLSFRIATKY